MIKIVDTPWGESFYDSVTGEVFIGPEYKSSHIANAVKRRGYAVTVFASDIVRGKNKDSVIEVRRNPGEAWCDKLLYERIQEAKR